MLVLDSQLKSHIEKCLKKSLFSFQKLSNHCTCLFMQNLIIPPRILCFSRVDPSHLYSADFLSHSFLWNWAVLCEVFLCWTVVYRLLSLQCISKVLSKHLLCCLATALHHHWLGVYNVCLAGDLFYNATAVLIWWKSLNVMSHLIVCLLYSTNSSESW